MKTSHGGCIDILPGIGKNIIIRVVDSEDRLAIVRLTLSEAAELFAFAEGVATKQGHRHVAVNDVPPRWSTVQ